MGELSETFHLRVEYGFLLHLPPFTLRSSNDLWGTKEDRRPERAVRLRREWAVRGSSQALASRTITPPGRNCCGAFLLPYTCEEREAGSLAQGHTAGRSQDWDLGSGWACVFS